MCYKSKWRWNWRSSSVRRPRLWERSSWSISLRSARNRLWVTATPSFLDVHRSSFTTHTLKKGSAWETEVVRIAILRNLQHAVRIIVWHTKLRHNKQLYDVLFYFIQYYMQKYKDNVLLSKNMLHLIQSLHFLLWCWCVLLSSKHKDNTFIQNSSCYLLSTYFSLSHTILWYFLYDLLYYDI